MNAQTTARLFGCTPGQAEEQMRKNIAQLESMHSKALSTGKKVNGYTADALADIIRKTKKGWNL